MRGGCEGRRRGGEEGASDCLETVRGKFQKQLAFISHHDQLVHLTLHRLPPSLLLAQLVDLGGARSRGACECVFVRVLTHGCACVLRLNVSVQCACRQYVLSEGGLVPGERVKVDVKRLRPGRPRFRGRRRGGGGRSGGGDCRGCGR